MKKYYLLTVLVFFLGFTSTMYLQTKEAVKKADKVEKKKDKAGAMTVAVMKTTMGTIELELFEKETPKTVENFIGLSKKGYYNGIIFHRVIDGFMIQGGDPTGTGTGGTSIWGKEFDSEIVPTLKHDKPGVLAMANRGPNTNTSQFYITLTPQTRLDGGYTIFGQVIKGMDVVKAIGKVPTKKPGDKPLKDVKIESVKIEKRDKK